MKKGNGILSATACVIHIWEHRKMPPARQIFPDRRISVTLFTCYVVPLHFKTCLFSYISTSNCFRNASALNWVR